MEQSKRGLPLPLLELPDLALDRIAKLLGPADRPRLMATCRKAAVVCMGSVDLKLRVDDRVKWISLKQVLPWANRLCQLMIDTNQTYVPAAEQADQQNLSACTVLLGPAYSSYMDGISLPCVQEVTMQGATGLPCLVPPFIAAVCPNMSSLVYKPTEAEMVARTAAATFSQSKLDALPVPSCPNLHHIECHALWLPPAYHTPDDLRRQLPNITSLTLTELTLKWLNTWSNQLTRLQLYQHEHGSLIARCSHSMRPAKTLRHLTIQSWDIRGSTRGFPAPDLKDFAPDLETLDLQRHYISVDQMRIVCQLTNLRSLIAADFWISDFSPEFSCSAIAPSLTSLVLSQHSISRCSMRLILQLTNLQTLTAMDLDVSSLNPGFSLQPIASSLTSLTLRKHEISKGSLRLIVQLTSLQSLHARDLTASAFTSNFNLQPIAPSMTSIQLSRHSLSEHSMRLIMQLTSLRSLTVQTLRVHGFSTNFSLYDCQWQRLELLQCKYINFEQLTKLPLGRLKELILNCDVEDSRSLGIHVPIQSNTRNLKDVCQARRYLLDSLSIKELESVVVRWNIEAGSSMGW